ncbi:MAG: accessory Sec system protein Asp2 [Streptococcus sp.]
MGTEELENSIKDTIQHYLDYLGFDSDQLILSGMSMELSHLCTMVRTLNLMPLSCQTSSQCWYHR